MKNLKQAIFQTLMAKIRCQSKQKDGTRFGTTRPATLMRPMDTKPYRIWLRELFNGENCFTAVII